MSHVLRNQNKNSLALRLTRGRRGSQLEIGSPLWTICEPCGLNSQRLPLPCSRGTPRLIGLGLLATLQPRERVLRIGEVRLDP
jgi:hypothetical protein